MRSHSILAALAVCSFTCLSGSSWALVSCPQDDGTIAYGMTQRGLVGYVVNCYPTYTTISSYNPASLISGGVPIGVSPTGVYEFSGTSTQSSNTGVYRFANGNVDPSSTGIYRFTDLITDTSLIIPAVEGTTVKSGNQMSPANDTGVAMAAVNVGSSVSNNIGSRLSSVRSGGGAGINTGDALNSRNLWLQTFGNITTQESKGGAAGYQAHMGGMTVGADTDELVEGVTLGAAVSYAQSSVDSKSSNSASTDTDSYMLTLYGSKDFSQGYYVAGQFGAGFNKYDSSRNIVGIGANIAAYNGLQYVARVDGGRDINLTPETVLTPLVSVQYTHLNTDGYTEKGPVALSVNSSTYDTTELGLGAKLGWDFTVNDSYTLNPTLRAKYLLMVGDRSLVTTSRFVGGGASFNTEGVEADAHALNLGAGLHLANAERVDFNLDYDADLRESLVGHTLQLKVRMAF